MATFILLLLLAACGQQQLPNVNLPADVNGTVVDVLGGGLGGKNVAVGNKITITASDGSFTLENIESPYDLINYSTEVGHVIEGVTSFSPQLIQLEGLFGGTGPVFTTATIDGSFVDPVPAGFIAQICVEGIDKLVFGCTQAAATDTGFTGLNATWSQGGSADVRVHVLFIQLGPDDLPVAYGSYGIGTGTIADSGTHTINVTLGSAPTENSLSVTVNMPGAMAIGSLQGNVRISDNFVLPIFAATAPAVTTFNLQVPALGDQRYQVLASGSDATGTGFGWLHDIAPGSSTSLNVTAPPTFTAPANGATGVTTDTPFTLDAPGEGINTFVFDDFTQVLAVTTTGETATIPDLDLYGLPVAAATSHSVSALHIPLNDASDLTSAWVSGYVDALLGFQSGGAGAGSDGGISATNINVTTQ